uniref:Uncharacterized protein n=1 Tax=Globodera pallida TaxID=36090 RepID=A0A183CMX7_GLOPA
MDKNSENTQEDQQINERIWVLEKKCKQLEEINAQYCDEDEQRLKQIDATEEENKALKKDNAFKAKQIQQEREENLQLKESLAEEQKKAEEMLPRNAGRIGFKASRMKPPSGASTPSSSSRSSSSTAGVNLQIHSVVTGASSFGKHKFTRDFSSLLFTPLQNSETNSIVSFGSSKNLVSSMFNSSQQLDDEGCQSLEDQLGALNDGEQQFSSNGELTEKDSAVFVSADANDMEGRDSGNFSDQDQQDTVDNTMSEEVLPYVPGEGRPAGMTLAEELKLAEQQQKLKEELEKAQLEQHQQQTT